MKKLQIIKGNMKLWNKEVFGNIEDSKNKISLALEVLDNMEEFHDLDTSEMERRKL